MGTKLKDSAGAFVKIQAGESCDLTGTLKDVDGAAVTPATLTLTLFDESTGVIVNSRSDQSVLNVNGGAVVDGVYTIELDGSDTVIVGDLAAGATQNRVARVAYTWDDGDSTRSGIEEFIFPVERLTDATGSGSGSTEVTVTITTSAAATVANASVYLTSDAAGLTVVAGPVLTGSDGISAVLSLDAGTYYRWASADGYSFTNPETITVV